MKRHFLIAGALLAAMPMHSMAARSAESAPPFRQSSPGFVAGLAPHQRPAGAPVVRKFIPDADWRRRALTGINEPLPVGLEILSRHGAWYTPFNQPGMPGPYDLRQWHQNDSANKPER